MLTETQDIQRAYCVTRACGPGARATVYPAVLAPLPAYGTRMRGIALIDCKSQHQNVGIYTLGSRNIDQGNDWKQSDFMSKPFAERRTCQDKRWMPQHANAMIC